VKTGRVARVVAAAGACVLAAVSLRTMYAEAAYETGLDASVDPRGGPALDVPGRLEAYEEAIRRDPDEALYALRAGQIHLARAARREGGVDRTELAAARTLLRRAGELRPIDGRPRAQLAYAAMMAGDSEDALFQAQDARALAPRAPAAMRAAVDVGLAVWRDTGDTSALRTALAGGAALAGIGEATPDRAFIDAFARAGPHLAQDLVDATKEDPALAAYAADAARTVRPEVARLLESSDGRTRKGP
jgi:hypothetical protein